MVAAATGQRPDQVEAMDPAAVFALAQEVIAWRARPL